MIQKLIFFLLCLSVFAFCQASNKVLICGVCKNIANGSVYVTMQNIEELGNCFDDYQVIIYENNSEDNTRDILAGWAERNPHVIFLSENLPASQLKQLSRVAAIARARNIVLSVAREARFNDYEHIIMADLDFIKPWPIDEIVATTNLKGDWDCISANGIMNDSNRYYWDRYAFSDALFPFGPELIGKVFWTRLDTTWFQVKDWRSVYSAFGGLAIYKRASMINFNYSATITEDLEKYYHQILLSLPKGHFDLQRYLKINGLDANSLPDFIRFQGKGASGKLLATRDIECCEHLTLHAAMALQGYGNFFINPNMIMNYDRPMLNFTEMVGPLE